MTEAVIHVERASVRYGDTAALSDVDLTVARGEFVGILGANGAGKTTLLRAVNGLCPLTDGRIRVLGIDVRSDGRAVRRRVGYVAQVEHVDPRLPMSVRETVMAGRYGVLGWLKRPSAGDRRRVDEALERVGMLHLADRPLGHLSGGEYQRAAVARALVQDPDVFLFDEPTASIDPQAQRDILDLVTRIHRDSHKTSLYVTHDLAMLPEACERLLLMKDGKVWREGPRGEMMDDRLLEALYNGVGGMRCGSVRP